MTCAICLKIFTTFLQKASFFEEFLVIDLNLLISEGKIVQ